MSREENQQINPHGTPSLGIEPQATLVGAECCHHDATTALNSLCSVWLSTLTVLTVQRVTAWATKSNFKNSSKITVSRKIFAQCETKDYLGQNIGFISERELKYATPFSHGRQREVSCFPI